MTPEVNDTLKRLNSRLDQVVLFRYEIKRLLLLALIARGHLLIEGLPGTAKTLLCRTFARLLGGEFRRVQGTPDILPADIVGFYLYRPSADPLFMPGPVFANVVMVDELNRLSPRTQSALLEAMQEEQVTVEGHTHPLAQPFMVVASQVPQGGQGTSPLSDVQADRFLFRAWSGHPGPEEEDQVMQQIDRIAAFETRPAASASEVAALQQAALAVHVSGEVRAYIISIMNAVREHPDVLTGPSLRGSLALYKGARAAAVADGRGYVIPDDVKPLVVPALFHRTVLKPEAETGGAGVEQLLLDIVSRTPVPRV